MQDRALAFLLTLAFLAPAADAAAACKLTNHTKKTVQKLGCTLTHHAAVVVPSGRKGTKVTVAGTELTCGKLALNPWTKLVGEALSACAEPSESGVDYDLSQGALLLSKHGPLVAVDQDDGGFTGGAHPYANTSRRTWNTRTGKSVTLKACFPTGHAALAKRAAAGLKKSKDAELYEFDPDAFAVKAVGGGFELRFRFGHAIEVARGTFRDVTFTTREAPACGR